MDFQNVIITGAASGIGAAIASSFAKRHANVCITDINGEDLDKISVRCRDLSKNKILQIVADVRKDEDRENIVKCALKEFGKINVLINSAGIYEASNLQDFDIIEKFDRTIAINLRSVIAMTNNTLRALIESKGCVINISSICSTLIFKDNLSYTIAKAGVSSFTKVAALELANVGVRVNCISPGPVKTNILKNAGVSEHDINKLLNNMMDRTPLKRLVTADEVAELAVYLASDKAASITGSDFLMDGGMILGTNEEPVKENKDVLS